MHRSILAFVRERLALAKSAPPGPWRESAIEELEEIESFILDEGYIEDWGED